MHEIFRLTSSYAQQQIKETGRHVPEESGRSEIRKLIFQGHQIIYLVGSEVGKFNPKSTF